MVTVEHMLEIAANLRAEGATASAEDLASAHEGVFSGTELAMKWRFYLSEALKFEGLSAPTRKRIEQTRSQVAAWLI